MEKKGGKAIGANAMKAQRNRRIPTIAFAENSLRFEFALPAYDQSESNRFRVLMSGFDSDWSPWTFENTKEYTNLPEGTYQFRVQAKNVYDQESIEGTYPFVILPPWYRTHLAYAGYIVTFILIIAVAVRLNSRRLLQAKRQLEQVVMERTAEVEQQKDQLANANQEMAKLTVAASKTNNAIAILDAQGNFEWVNEKFIQIYGETVASLKKNKRGNLACASSHPNRGSIRQMYTGENTCNLRNF